MKRTLFQKALCFLLSVVFLLGSFGITVSAAGLKDTSNQTSLEDMQAFLNADSYEEYVKDYQETLKPGLPTIKIPVIPNDTDIRDGFVVNDPRDTTKEQNALITDSFNSDVDGSKWGAFGDENWGNSVYLPASGAVTWRFNITDATSSWYYLKLEYYTVNTEESSVSAIERKLFIDDVVPFTEASMLSLTKTWHYAYTSTKVEDTTEPDSLAKASYAQKDDGYYKYVVSVKDGKKTTVTYKMSQDINGNSMAPDVVQDSVWNTYFAQSTTGYYHGYYMFFFLTGEHTITLEAQREPMIIRSIELVPVDDPSCAIPSYNDVLADYANKGYQAANGGSITTIQGEFPDYVSDTSVSPTNQNSSSATYPSSSSAQLYNVIGENSFNAVGQWAAYKFTVDKTGLYKIGMRYLQSTLQGMYVCRTIKLAGGDYGLEDGTPTVPFMEAYNAQFNFNDEWQSNYIGDGTIPAFEFYFEEGVEYTLYVECSLGSLSSLIKDVEECLNEVNSCYLKILQLTGSDADEYRDYNFYGIMPEVLVSLLENAKFLTEVSAELQRLCGTKGSHLATLDTIAILLDRMGRDEGTEIAKNMGNLKSNVGTLGTWINSSKQSSLTIDSISIVPADQGDKALPRAKAGFFQSLWFEISSFFYSFFTDYDAMGLTRIPDENTTTVQVWLATGRDQSSIWRTMIDAQGSFTDRTGNAVSLKLVTGSTLLPSILAGKGPDVYLGLDSSTVINYAIRDAILGVSGNDKQLSDADNAVFNTTYYTYEIDGQLQTTTTPIDGQTPTFISNKYEDAVKVWDKDFDYGSAAASEAVYDDANYVQAALDTITLLGVTYGIPQTMSFAMMFYRGDVLAQLNEEVPETWDELLALLPVLQANNMTVGVASGSAINFILYQRGGNMWKYTEIPEYAGAEIGLDTNIALEAFDYVCRLYTNYSFPVSFDGANRFRTGEMPIIVGDYGGLYNQLVVFATEIAGLWEFCSLPGWYHEATETDEAYLNYDSLAGVGSTILLYGCDNVLAAWQFMQWQTGEDVQANYGNKMVALIGPSAKYEAANIKAIKNLSWTASEKEAIEDQIRHLSSVVNYPGSYIIGRYTNFAFLAAVNSGADPVDAMSGYIDAINAEIARKREEFDLATEVPEEIKKLYGYT